MSDKIKPNIDNFQKILTELIGFELHNIRKEKGLSGSKLAKKLKLSQQQISRYERGECSISCGTLFLILFHLETNPVVFLRKITLALNESHPKAISYLYDADMSLEKKDDFNYLFHKETEILLNSSLKNNKSTLNFDR
ncbi:helix-turn-helix domain-containing protein [Providencia burhodogranariea]|uniref:Fimbrial operon regulator n=1 Tax=Providencia burhodogranariea DSM 19968 TaxID=1141662 RepID=K8VZE4_9GAMM|nr:helix-turn-helix transcriptional regulator [Providencia burhodogranariea]EKT53658.1 fimbrial operon regulator [Providencia burhodogranariea DSM 19968]